MRDLLITKNKVNNDSSLYNRHAQHTIHMYIIKLDINKIFIILTLNLHIIKIIYKKSHNHFQLYKHNNITNYS